MSPLSSIRYQFKASFVALLWGGSILRGSMHMPFVSRLWRSVTQCRHKTVRIGPIGRSISVIAAIGTLPAFGSNRDASEPSVIPSFCVSVTVILDPVYWTSFEQFGKSSHVCHWMWKHYLGQRSKIVQLCCIERFSWPSSSRFHCLSEVSKALSKARV